MGECVKMVRIDAQDGFVGSTREEGELGYSANETRQRVSLTRNFWLQESEVTQAQWEAVMGTTPSYHSGCPT